MQKWLRCKIHNPQNQSFSELGQSFPLLEYIHRRFTYLSKEEWGRLIQEGYVLVNAKPARVDSILCHQDEIQFYLPPNYQYEPPVDTKYHILYEDAFLLAVDKPGDLPIHPAGRYQENTLLSILEKSYGKLYTIHRLDRETSGMVLFAKDESSAKKLSYDFKNKKVKKTYLAWVYGNFPKEYHAIGFLEKDFHSPILKKQVFRESSDGNVETMFQKVSYYGGVSLVLAIPITGKMHQIRATLCSLGYPIVGDKIYGVRDTAFLDFIQTGNTPSLIQELGCNRQALHALSLEFQHPQSKEKMEIVSHFPQLEIRLKLEE